MQKKSLYFILCLILVFWASNSDASCQKSVTFFIDGSGSMIKEKAAGGKYPMETVLEALGKILEEKESGSLIKTGDSVGIYLFGKDIKEILPQKQISSGENLKQTVETFRNKYFHSGELQDKDYKRDFSTKTSSAAEDIYLHTDFRPIFKMIEKTATSDSATESNRLFFIFSDLVQEASADNIKNQNDQETALKEIDDAFGLLSTKAVNDFMNRANALVYMPMPVTSNPDLRQPIHNKMSEKLQSLRAKAINPNVNTSQLISEIAAILIEPIDPIKIEQDATEGGKKGIKFTGFNKNCSNVTVESAWLDYYEPTNKALLDSQNVKLNNSTEFKERQENAFVITEGVNPNRMNKLVHVRPIIREGNIVQPLDKSGSPEKSAFLGNFLEVGDIQAKSFVNLEADTFLYFDIYFKRFDFVDKEASVYTIDLTDEQTGEPLALEPETQQLRLSELLLKEQAGHYYHKALIKPKVFEGKTDFKEDWTSYLRPFVTQKTYRVNLKSTKAGNKEEAKIEKNLIPVTQWNGYNSLRGLNLFLFFMIVLFTALLFYYLFRFKEAFNLFFGPTVLLKTILKLAVALASNLCSLGYWDFISKFNLIILAFIQAGLLLYMIYYAWSHFANDYVFNMLKIKWPRGESINGDEFNSKFENFVGVFKMFLYIVAGFWVLCMIFTIYEFFNFILL